MDNIKIERHPEADTRTAEGLCSVRELAVASAIHIDDVANALDFFKGCLDARAKTHDYDKLTDISGFYRDYRESLLDGGDFTEKPWYQKHRNMRHHALRELDDVNFIDVLEYICDVVCANSARRGDTAFDVEPLSGDVLERAFDNTVKLLQKSITIVE